MRSLRFKVEFKPMNGGNDNKTYTDRKAVIQAMTHILWYGIVNFFVDWIKQIIKMKQYKEYRVVMYKFIGYTESGSATYEITFNKSLEHTGRFIGIEDGLNAYCKKERTADITDNLKRLWYSLVRCVKK